MNVVVTGGGTVAPIDDVRQIANVSTGRFSASITEACLARGATVWHVHAPGAQLPLLRQGQQFAIRHRRPQEIREPRGEGVIVQLGATVLARIIDALDQEQEMGRAEGGRVTDDHRLGERGTPVEGRVDQLQGFADRLRADGPPEGPGQERSQQPFGLLARLRGGRDERVVAPPAVRAIVGPGRDGPPLTQSPQPGVMMTLRASLAAALPNTS